jgi:hypothetical protein
MRAKLVVALVVLALAPAMACAQSSISYTSGPTGGTGTVTASGTLTLGTGESVTTVTLYCVACGAEGGENGCAVQTLCMGITWSGTVNNLPSGTYLVFARLKTSASGCVTNINDSPAIMVPVK